MVMVSDAQARIIRSVAHCRRRETPHPGASEAGGRLRTGESRIRTMTDRDLGLTRDSSEARVRRQSSLEIRLRRAALASLLRGHRESRFLPFTQVIANSLKDVLKLSFSKFAPLTA